MKKKFDINNFDDMFAAAVSEERDEGHSVNINKMNTTVYDSFYTEWKNINTKEISAEKTEEPAIESDTIDFNNGIILPEQEKKSKNKKPLVINSIHKDHRRRVRNKFNEFGLETFTPIEVLEFLLHFAIPVRDTNEIAHRLLDKFGSLKAVLNAEYYDLTEVEGVGEIAATLIILNREIFKYVRTREYESVNISTSRAAGKFFIDYFASHVEESFVAVSLTPFDDIEKLTVISRGTESETGFYPRKLLKEMLSLRATKIIISHNHPGNNAEPSTNDIIATRNLIKTLDEVGITLKDHIICAGDIFVSMSDRGLLSTQ